MCRYVYIYISLLNYAYNMIIKIIKLYVCLREREYNHIHINI